MDPAFSSAYCERLDGAFWAEPFNAVSNAAFLLAALAIGGALRREWRAGGRDWPALALCLVLGAISFGSFLFHTRPGRITVLADVIPIQLFVLGYFALALRRFLALGTAGTLLGVGVLVAGSMLSAWLFGDALNGSIAYAPALVSLFALGYWLLARARRSVFALAARGFDAPEVAEAGMRAAFVGRMLVTVGVIFLVSLAFRTLDRPLCPAWPVGTHFLWHGLNALVLYLLLRTALRYKATPG